MSSVPELQSWLVSHGGQFHKGVAFQEVPSGYTIVAKDALPEDTTVVSCPFSLAITPKLALDALNTLMPRSPVFVSWTERQLICSYIALHWITAPSLPSVLVHLPYINTLPAPDALRTPLHFTKVELEAFRGTNLYGAAVDRETEWKLEWQVCQQGIMDAEKKWGGGFVWEHYLTAATYLSSRAFPSTLLSPTPSLIPTKESHPVLLPGVDSLNHKRGTPVSWEVDYPKAGEKREPLIKLTLHSAHAAGDELFNNYGAKPNAELILGYGFAVENNEDDTIVLRIGGADDVSDDESEEDDGEEEEEAAKGKGKGKGKATEEDDEEAEEEDDEDEDEEGNTQRWDVGRGAHGAESLWDTVVKLVGAHGVERDECGCGHEHGASPAAETSHSDDHSGHSHDDAHASHSHRDGGCCAADHEEEAKEEEDASRPTWEGELDASSVLMGMVVDVLSRLPTIGRTDEDLDEDEKVKDAEQKANRLLMRPEVLAMLTYYVQGQRDVLESLLEFAKKKEAAAVEAARADGVELKFEDEEE